MGRNKFRARLTQILTRATLQQPLEITQYIMQRLREGHANKYRMHREKTFFKNLIYLIKSHKLNFFKKRPPPLTYSSRSPWTVLGCATVEAAVCDVKAVKGGGGRAGIGLSDSGFEVNNGGVWEENGTRGWGWPRDWLVNGLWGSSLGRESKGSSDLRLEKTTSRQHQILARKKVFNIEYVAHTSKLWKGNVI